MPGLPRFPGLIGTASAKAGEGVVGVGARACRACLGPGSARVGAPVAISHARVAATDMIRPGGGIRFVSVIRFFIVFSFFVGAVHRFF